MDTELKDAADQHRFELWSGDELIGVLAYRLDGDALELVHTEVAPEHGGRGHAATLVRGALDEARARGLAVVPSCSYVASYVEEHPEYADLVR
ncbi:GNAT family N-acetyltransferase [Nocardioides sp. SYSU D00065]|uniref:GNAT family N-acetyltransferase n=1 Tax=Nocardioides sp. SYSU D00065 TaxID=2817378 RepID=UPI001B3247E3|nr:GNAT family N-acetyltransferase [Nocardioides sp. SYSU D00065]